MSKKTPTTRRDFLKTLAATAIAPSMLSIRDEEGTRGAALQQQPPQPLTPSAAAEALGELVRVRYGQFLTAEQLAEVTRQIERSLRSAERLRHVALTNADEPDVIFRATL